MNLVLFPGSENMMQEIQQWVALRRWKCSRASAMTSHTNGSIIPCRRVLLLQRARRGIPKVVHEKKWNTAECDEEPGVS